MRTKKSALCLMCALILMSVGAEAANTGFTYQGMLKDGANPANGSYDFRFTLYDAVAGGSVIGTNNPYYVDDKMVVGGLFSAEINFDASTFILSGGADFYIEVAVRPGSVSNSVRTGYTALAPRQKITPTPYSLSTVNSTNLGGKPSGDYMLAATDKWVNTSGDTMTGTLIIENSSIWSLEIRNSSANNNASAIFAEANSTTANNSNAGYFKAAGPRSIAVEALATGESSTGIQGRSDGSSGTGVVGVALAEGDYQTVGGSFYTKGYSGTGVRGSAYAKGDYTNYGGEFSAAGYSGIGVSAIASATGNVSNVGGKFESWGQKGIGVIGFATSETGENFGGHFTAAGGTGRGVYGSASSKNVDFITYGGYFESLAGYGYGVYGESKGASGIGVYGLSSGGGTPSKYGGYFRANGENGRGIYAAAAYATGDTRAVQGYVLSPAGFSAYFEGAVGSANYFQRRVGIGNTDPNANLHVASLNKWNWGEGNGWGDFCVGTSTYGLSIGIATSGGGAGIARMWTQNNSLILGTKTGGDTITITTAKRVGIGRPPATNKLEVEGDASKSTAGNWLANSDARIKTDVRTITGALEKLASVRLVDFEYTPEYLAEHAEIEPRRYMNVIAQEFAEVFPDYVKDSGETLFNGVEILQVDPYPLTIYSAAAVQELYQIIKERDNEISNLRKENRKLEERLSRLESILLSEGSR